MKAKSPKRKETLIEEIAKFPVVDLIGLVDASGVGAGISKGEKLWTLAFTFDAWKLKNGTICKAPLTVRRQVTEKSLRKFQVLIDSESIVHIRARLAVQNSVGFPQALLEKFIRIVPDDSELNDFLIQLKKPVTFKASKFGIFTLDRRIKWFRAQKVWCGTEIKLNLAADVSTEVSQALDVAKQLWKSARKWNSRIQDFAIRKLLPLKNNSWDEEDGHEVTETEFKKRMTLECITVYPDGSFDFWHYDGDLFYGHSIEVNGTLSRGPTHAGIVG